MRYEDYAERAAKHGYVPDQHIEADSQEAQYAYSKKTLRDQDMTLDRWVVWHLVKEHFRIKEQGGIMLTEDEVRNTCLARQSLAPNRIVVKDFLRYICKMRKGVLSKMKLMTVDSVKTIAEWLFAGFTRVTGTIIGKEFRKEIYNWCRTSLVADGLAVNLHKIKYLFTRFELERAIETLWTKDDPIFIPEFYRVQMTWIWLEYCNTGARLGAFFDGEVGLTYSNFEIMLKQKTARNDDWELCYQLKQRWTKGNKDPENQWQGSAGRGSIIMKFDTKLFFLARALQDHAIFGIDSVEDLFRQRLKTGQDVKWLRVRDEVRHLPFLRTCTKSGGVTNQPLSESTFLRVFNACMRNAGYVWQVSIHAIRRAVGKEVDKHYTEVQQSQTLGQSDMTVFGRSYLANSASTDTLAAFLGEPLDHSHIEVFQSLEKFREPGLPLELPSQKLSELGQDPFLLELQTDLRTLHTQKSNLSDIELAEETRKAKRRITTWYDSIKRKALHDYQQDWLQEQRDKAVTGPQDDSTHVAKADMAVNWSLLIPERRRLAMLIMQKTPMTVRNWWQALADLYSLCIRDMTSIYFPGCEPVNDKCPASCGLEIERPAKIQTEPAYT